MLGARSAKNSTLFIARSLYRNLRSQRVSRRLDQRCNMRVVLVEIRAKAGVVKSQRGVYILICGHGYAQDMHDTLGAFYFQNLKKSLIFDCLRFRTSNGRMRCSQSARSCMATSSSWAPRKLRKTSKESMTCDAVTDVGTVGTPCPTSSSSDESAAAAEAARALLRISAFVQPCTSQLWCRGHARCSGGFAEGALTGMRTSRC